MLIDLFVIYVELGSISNTYIDNHCLTGIMNKCKTDLHCLFLQPFDPPTFDHDFNKKNIFRFVLGLSLGFRFGLGLSLGFGLGLWLIA